MRPNSAALKMGVITASLLLFSLVILSHTLLAHAASGQSDSSQFSPALASGNARVDIISSTRVSGLTGQFVAVRANITNPSSNETIAGIAYISIVDVNNSLPIDLEDWSAAKGVYVPSIAPGQSVTLEWNLRLVKSGSYTVDVLFNKDGDLSVPTVSSRISLEVVPKVNLNPSNVLPVAFGVPTLLVVILAVINYRRGKKTGVYG